MGSKGTQMYVFIKILQKIVEYFQYFGLKWPISENVT